MFHSFPKFIYLSGDVSGVAAQAVEIGGEPPWGRGELLRLLTYVCPVLFPLMKNSYINTVPIFA